MRILAVLSLFWTFSFGTAWAQQSRQVELMFNLVHATQGDSELNRELGPNPQAVVLANDRGRLVIALNGKQNIEIVATMGEDLPSRDGCELEYKIQSYPVNKTELLSLNFKTTPFGPECVDRAKTHADHLTVGVQPADPRVATYLALTEFSQEPISRPEVTRFQFFKNVLKLIPAR